MALDAMRHPPLRAPRLSCLDRPSDARARRPGGFRQPSGSRLLRAIRPISQTIIGGSQRRRRAILRSGAGGRPRARQQIGIDSKRPVLLFVGRFVEKKGLHILGRLAGRLTEMSWIFAGWGPLDPRSWRYPHVHVFVDRQDAELVPLYQAADLLVRPSVGEGLPLVVQESMSCGTPVMVGEDTAEAVDAVPGFVFAKKVCSDRTATADDWEAALGRILNDVGPLSERQSAIAEFARTRWSRDRCAATYESPFELIGIDA